MSKPFDASRANTLPMDELCTLIGVERTLNANGYDATREEPEREVFCGFAQGVSRTEYYEAMKAGVRLSATVEIWEDDYQGERLLEHGGHRYRVGRTWPTGRGTLQLYLEEVRR